MSWHLNPHTGLLDQAKNIPSPYCDERSRPEDIALIVIHGISLPPGEFGGSAVIDFFTHHLNPDAHPYFKEIAHLKVSAHFFIRRTGELIQLVPVHKRAWHAGSSLFRDRAGCNDFSIGIELEGTDSLPYTAEQYEVLVKLCHLLKQSYVKITEDSIVGHSDISPGRKTDPGASFDWPRFKAALEKEDLR